MANDFTQDEDVVAYYSFDESVFLLSDRVSTNDLSVRVTSSSATQVRDTSDKVSGIGSIRIDLQADGGTSRILRRLDSGLTSDFPLKSGTSNNKFTVGWWHKLVVDDPGGEGFSGNCTLGKWSTDITDPLFGSAPWTVAQVYSSTTGLGAMNFRIKNSGGVAQSVPFASGWAIETWYHIVLSYDGDTGAYRLSIYDDTAEALLEPDTTGFVTADPLYNASDFMLLSGTTTAGNPTGSTVEGHWRHDEIVIFKRVLTEVEIGNIRIGVFGGGGGGGTLTSLPAWPAVRPDDYDYDFFWKPGVWAGGNYTASAWDEEYVATGGGRWNQQLIAVGKSNIYYETLT